MQKILLYDYFGTDLRLEDAWQQAVQQLPGSLNPEMVVAIEALKTLKPGIQLFWDAWAKVHRALWLVEVDGVKYHVEELCLPQQGWLVAEGHTLYLD